MVDLAGKKTTLTGKWASEGGLAWSSKGDEVWFTATEAGANRSLYAVDLGGKLRVVTRVPGGLKLHDIARSGRVLLTRESRASGSWECSRGTPASRTCRTWTTPSPPTSRRTRACSSSTRRARREAQNYTVYLGRKRRLARRAAWRGQRDRDLAEREVGALESSNADLAADPPPDRHRRATTDHRGRAQRRAGRGVAAGRQHLVYAARRRNTTRLYVQALDGGKPRPMTPKGIVPGLPGSRCRRTEGGSRSSAGPEGTLHSAIDGSARPLAGVAEESFRCDLAGRKTLYTWKRGEVPARSRGRSDRTTEGLEEAHASRPGRSRPDLERRRRPDGHGLAYSFARVLSDLFVVEGLNRFGR